ncbi:MAG: hypothetical protein GX077_03820 [Tissierellia bacterium]|nr:hypothetical protein [Tissierellia bacterium]
MDNSLLLIILLIILRSSRINEFGGLKSFSDYLRSLKIEPDYTLEKIKLLKKIGPYFPEEYIPTINRSILLTERIIKINELASFMKYDEYQYIKSPIPIKDNKERISKILNIVQREVSKSENNNFGMVMDLIVNMDKYKNLLSMLNSVKSNEEGLKDPSQLLNIFGPIIGIDINKDKDKLKDINRMMEIIKTLNSKKEITGENKDLNKLPDTKKNHLEGS